MAWSKLSSRLNSLPLLLAGPIVRRAEATNVSIWFTLYENRDVTLNIFDTNNSLVVAPIITGNQSAGIIISSKV